MSRIVDLLIRLIGILAAYGVAALASSIFIHALSVPMLGLQGHGAPWAPVGGLIISIPFLALLIAGFAFVPAAILIGISEMLRYRSWLYHALAGAACAYLSFSITSGVDPSSRGGEMDGELLLGEMPETIALLMAAGIVGGIVYWLLCGRRAGHWLDRYGQLSGRERSGS